MKPREYIRKLSMRERAELAKRCETTVGTLNNLVGDKTCGPRLAVALERESGGVVTREESCADWQAVWPELIGRQKAVAA